jgi:lipopolysaccharide export system permease protein
MKLNSIINRYIFWEMVPPFLVNLIFFTFVFLMGNILRVTNLVVNYNVSFLDILAMIAFMVPFFLEYVIPISVMIAVLLTFLRLTSDSEIIAIEASGISLVRLLPPVFLFCIIGFVMACSTSVFAVPWGKTSLKRLTYEVATQNLDIGLKERTFIDYFEGITLFVNDVDPKADMLYDVFIEDQRSEKFVSTIIAPEGRFFTEEGKTSSLLRLMNGTINQVDIKGRSSNAIKFDTYDVYLDLETNKGGPVNTEKHRLEMTVADFRAYFRTTPVDDPRYNSMLAEYHQKFSIPFACVALGFLAIPLGIMSGAARRSFGLGLSVLLFLVYYVLLFAAQVFSDAGIYSPVFGVWLPNFVMLALGLFFFVRTLRNQQVDFEWFSNFLRKMRLKSTPS